MRQIIKHVFWGFVDRNKPEVEKTDKVIVKETKNKANKNKEAMISEKINTIEEAVNDMSAVKIVKKDKGLIERTESSKIVLTEDNRQVLVD